MARSRWLMLTLAVLACNGDNGDGTDETETDSDTPTGDTETDVLDTDPQETDVVDTDPIVAMPMDVSIEPAEPLVGEALNCFPDTEQQTSISWSVDGQPAGVSGATVMMWFQVWASAVDWPLNVGGKPLNSLPAFVPVAFEMAVLMAGLGIIATLLLRSRLFPWVKPQLAHPRVTDDYFVLSIRQTDADLDPDLAARLMRDHGAIEVNEDTDGETS